MPYPNAKEIEAPKPQNGTCSVVPVRHVDIKHPSCILPSCRRRASNCSTNVRCSSIMASSGILLSFLPSIGCLQFGHPIDSKLSKHLSHILNVHFLLPHLLRFPAHICSSQHIIHSNSSSRSTLSKETSFISILYLSIDFFNFACFNGYFCSVVCHL